MDSNNRNSRRSSWGRFGEPEEVYSPQDDSLKLPKRRGSYNGSEHREEEEINGKANKSTTKSTSTCSPTMMLAGSNKNKIKGRHSRLHRRSFRQPSFEIPSFEGSNSFSSSSSDFDEDNENFLIRKAAQQHLQHQHPERAFELLEPPTTRIRRASTGTRFPETSFSFDSQPLHSLQDEKPRRVSISGPRPCMESSLANPDVPLRRRSLGGTRPCMENSLGGPSDVPILRPYRQLSSDDLCINMGCIGEETDEDLRSHRSNRSCLTSMVDFSNRSKRTTDLDFSTRSNRTNSIADFSIRSNRTASIAADFSTRSNCSAFRDFSTRSRASAGLLEQEAKEATTTSSARTVASTSSPLLEEGSDSSASPIPAEPEVASPTTVPQPESWPVKPSANCHIKDNPSFRRSKTWPTNLMVLLSMKKLSLKNLTEEDSDLEDSQDLSLSGENWTVDRREGKSNSPCRNNRRLLRTIDRASELIDGDNASAALSILNNL